MRKSYHSYFSKVERTCGIAFLLLLMICVPYGCVMAAYISAVDSALDSFTTTIPLIRSTDEIILPIEGRFPARFGHSRFTRIKGTKQYHYHLNTFEDGYGDMYSVTIDRQFTIAEFDNDLYLTQEKKSDNQFVFRFLKIENGRGKFINTSCGLIPKLLRKESQELGEKSLAEIEQDANAELAKLPEEFAKLFKKLINDFQPHLIKCARANQVSLNSDGRLMGEREAIIKFIREMLPECQALDTTYLRLFGKMINPGGSTPSCHSLQTETALHNMHSLMRADTSLQ